MNEFAPTVSYGLYKHQLTEWLSIPNVNLIIIPAKSFYAEREATVAALVAAWTARSGGAAVLPTKGDAADSSSSNSSSSNLNYVAHPTLQQDITNPAHRLALSALFNASNDWVYQQAETNRLVTVIPHAVGTQGYEERFLDTAWD